MTPADLIAHLAGRDIRLSLRLVVDAPAGWLTDEDRAALASHKATLVHHLAREALWEQLAPLRWSIPNDNDEPPDILADEPPLDSRADPTCPRAKQ